MAPYIRYTIKGLSGIGISSEEHSFDTQNVLDTKSVDLTCEDDNICALTVSFCDNTIIDQTLLDNTEQMVRLYIADLLGRLGATTNRFSLNVDHISNPNLSTPESDGLIFNSILMMVDSLKVSLNFPINRYKDIFDNLPTDPAKQENLLLFFNIMQIDNIAIRYLMLYELLLNLSIGIRTSKRSQANVTGFIRDSFNPAHPVNCVGSHPTRRSGKDYDEDDITYYRNLLSHNDSSATPPNFEEKISEMSHLLIQVIFFRFDNM